LAITVMAAARKSPNPDPRRRRLMFMISTRSKENRQSDDTPRLLSVCVLTHAPLQKRRRRSWTRARRLDCVLMKQKGSPFASRGQTVPQDNCSCGLGSSAVRIGDIRLIWEKTVSTSRSRDSVNRRFMAASKRLRALVIQPCCSIHLPSICATDAVPNSRVHARVVFPTSND